jgi:hypothetical protein
VLIVPPVATQGKFPCQLHGCDKSFDSEFGLKVHIGKSHKAARDAAAEPTQNLKWLDDEVAMLISEYSRLPSDSKVNWATASRALAQSQLFRTRTEASIYARLIKDQRCKALLAQQEAAKQREMRSEWEREFRQTLGERGGLATLNQPPTSPEMAQARRLQQEPVQPSQPESPTICDETQADDTAEMHVPQITSDTHKEPSQKPQHPPNTAEGKLRAMLATVLRETTDNPAVCAANQYVTTALHASDPNAGWEEFVDKVKPSSRQTGRRAPAVQPAQPGTRMPPIKRKKYVNEVERRTKFAEHQNAWRKNPRIVAHSIIEGLPFNAKPPPVDVVDAEFRPRFETVTLAVDDLDYTVKVNANNDQSIRPASCEDVIDTLKRLGNNSAPGPDSDITARFVKQLPIGVFLRIWNLWLYLGRVPKTIKQSRTALLPKSADGLQSPSNWRPITVASVWQRTYSSFLVTRLRLDLDPRQKAFTAGVDGVGEHTAVIKHVLRTAYKSKQSLDVAFLDVSKAFDNVSHASLMRALRRLDIHPKFQAIVSDFYTEAGTSIRAGNGNTEQIMFRRGIRQGDPLSPTLFNAVLDELLENLGTKFGAQLGNDVKLNALAFADDLVIISPSSVGTQVLLDEVKSFFDGRGMAVNAQKSVGVRLRPTRGHKWTMMCVTNQDPIIYDGQPLSMTSAIDAAKYLGVRVTASGRTTMDFKCISDITTRLLKAPLRPMQKVEVVRSYLVPRLVYHMARADNIGSGALNEADRIIRATIRSALHLTKATCTEIFEIDTCAGGLGIPNLFHEVSVERVRITDRLRRSADATVYAVGQSPHNEDQHRVALKRIARQTSPTTSWGWKTLSNDRQKALVKAYAKTASGRGAECVASSTVGRSWLQGRPEIHNARVCWAVKVLIGRLPTRANTVHDVPARHPRRMCRRCGLWQEYASHVLQNCQAMLGARINRHNFLVDLLKRELVRQEGTKVFVEPVVWTGPNTRFRPDLVVVRGTHAWTIDAAVPYENDLQSLANAAKGKLDKYGPIEEHVRHKFGVETVATRALIVGARGTWFAGNDGLLKELEIRSDVKHKMALGALMGSVSIWRAFAGGIVP